MPSFEHMFMESKGKPISYQGRTLVMVDHFPTEGAKRFRPTFEQCNAVWRQGISLRLRDKGQFVINNQNLKHAVCWQDTSPSNFEFEVSIDVPSIEVKNVWDTGAGVTESWHNGAAMIVENVTNGSRYHCNDGEPDDDFDDIVFCIARLE